MAERRRRRSGSAARRARWRPPEATSGSGTSATASCSVSILEPCRSGPGFTSAAASRRSLQTMGCGSACTHLPASPGGTLTAVGSYAVIDTVDPAGSTSWNVPPPQGLGLTNDGLVTLDHVAGPEGSRLVPDLALALPTPDGRRTYLHDSRSDRESATPTARRCDPAMSPTRSSGCSRSAPQARRCTQRSSERRPASGHPAGCDLSGGIVADDRTGAVTFRLSQPDPDFLYKLTISYAYVLPAATPERQARMPLPATGPYMITRYIAGRELRLVRNPYFHEWSAAAQPSGYPDRITIPLGLSPAQAETAIAGGHVDFDPNLGRLPGRHAKDLLVDRRVQVDDPSRTGDGLYVPQHQRPTVHPGRRAPSAEPGLRPHGGRRRLGRQPRRKPTCQLLPPGDPWIPPILPRHQPSGRRRTLEGNRSRPGEAARRRFGHPGYARRRLERQPVALGGHRGDQACGDGPSQAGLPCVVAPAPRRAPISPTPATLATAPKSSTVVSAPTTRPPVTSSASSPAGSSSLVTASTPRTPASSATRGSIARSRAPPRYRPHQPAAADRLWSRLDRKLTDLAILVPTVTPNAIDVVSRHIHDYQYNPVWGALLDQLRPR